MDFHWDVDGETFDYSIAGGTSILLSELLKALSIDISVENIADVTFSDSKLLVITRVGGDWKLKREPRRSSSL